MSWQVDELTSYYFCSCIAVGLSTCPLVNLFFRYAQGNFFLNFLGLSTCETQINMFFILTFISLTNNCAKVKTIDNLLHSQRLLSLKWLWQRWSFMLFSYQFRQWSRLFFSQKRHYNSVEGLLWLHPYTTLTLDQSRWSSIPKSVWPYRNAQNKDFFTEFGVE